MTSPFISVQSVRRPLAPIEGDEETVDTIVRSLRRAGSGRAFSSPTPAAVEYVQTHISHVFLSGDRVFKLRKPVSLGFLDFSTRSLRNADCLQELRLNRRASPAVYLGIAPVVRRGDGYCVGTRYANPTRADLDDRYEHCVVMERLPTGRDALSLLQRNALDACAVDAVVGELARFHAAYALGKPAPGTPEQWRERVQRVVQGNFAVLGSRASGARMNERLVRIEAAAAAAFERLTPDLDRRWADGRMVDGHGDLHLEHIWFPDASRPPVLVDCIEFNESFRHIDRASEIAFLAMDLTYRGRADLAEHALAAYARATDDYHLFAVVDFHASYRAAVRAKVAALTSDQPEVPSAQRAAAASSATRHLALAERYLDERQVGAVVCMTGTVGSGKTTAASALAARLGAVTISTDAVRRRLDENGFERLEGVRYGLQRRRDVYSAVLERAAWVVRSGRTVVLDATFESADLRATALRWAASFAAPAYLVRTCAARSVAVARLAARRRDPHEQSEAGPEQLADSLARYEEPSEWPAARSFALDTDARDWTASLDRVADAVLAGGGGRT